MIYIMSFIAEQISNAGIQVAGKMAEMGISHDVLTKLSEMQVNGSGGDETINWLRIAGTAAAGFLVGLFFLGIQPKSNDRSDAPELLIEGTVAGLAVGGLLEVIRINQ